MTVRNPSSRHPRIAPIARIGHLLAEALWVTVVMTGLAGGFPQGVLGADPATDEGARHWAFQPVGRPKPPEVRDAGWPIDPADRFVLARLEATGLRPVRQASPLEWLRRASFDLTGLPPTPEQVAAFTPADGAGVPESRYTRQVDDWLASPAFGQRWARHWLDVARFAESAGKERNHLFPEAWRYRDWVVDAFNADKPYADFLREQVAGDLIARTAPPEQRDGLVVATGFLAIGTKGLNEGRREQFLADLVDEQIDTTTRAILGVTVACARCHDHKFDPISQRDYYALAGIFRSTETCYGTTGDKARNRQPSSLIPLTRAARSELALEPRPGPPLRRRSPERAGRPAGIPDNRATNAMAMGAREGRPEDAFFLVRGEVTQRSGRVPRGLLPLLGPTNGLPIPPTGSGRRELADWLAHPENPLTARVAVNRIWQHLFGRGLVGSGDDFGRNGQSPTHPELLDHLARRFLEGGGSTKSLVRQLVLSRTYRLSSEADPAALAVDPDDDLLWRARPRRLDAESLRDAVLSVAGTLDPRPLRGSVVAQIGDTALPGRLVGERAGERLDRRSLYLPVIRDAVPEVLDIFDAAEPSLVVAQRDETLVPSQSLFLMNSPFAQTQARALARRLLEAPVDDDAGRVALAYRLALARDPRPREVDRALGFIRREAAARDTRNGRPPGRETAWSLFAQALFACAEFRYLP
jgi:hypothetical protein